MSYRLHIGRPLGFALECPDMGTQLFTLGHQIGYANGKGREIIYPSLTHRCRERIPASRNQLVADAIDAGATHLLMLDPDVALDHYVGREPWAVPWFSTFWSFAMANHGSVLAAPYCGRGLADPPVQVFDGGTTETERRRVPWNDARQRRGWQRVTGVGTGLMLIDMRIFERLKPPYFIDHYADETCTRLDYTPDLWFCQLCCAAGIPIYVNWDCWVGHWQNQIVACPRVGEQDYGQETQAAPGSRAAIGTGKASDRLPDSGL